jgi:3-methyl-2-oxobutanoate hydroxymethyltransferase
MSTTEKTTTGRAKGGAAATDPPVPEMTVRRKVTVRTLHEKHERGAPIAMLTAYDYPTARLVDAAGVDAILVGDSLAMVVLGHDNTLSVTMDEMLHHCRAVARGADSSLLIGDMPFMSYQADTVEAVRNAGRFLGEGGMDAVKLEGGQVVADTVRAIVSAGIPVMGHIGLTPQSVNALGGWRVQGKTAESAAALVRDALALERAGCFAIVLESMPDRVAAHITERLTVPTIGIGAGRGVSGQVLVLHDMIGLFDQFTPKFVRRYAEVAHTIREAVGVYRDDVAAGRFPGDENAYTMSDEEFAKFLALQSRPQKRRWPQGDPSDDGWETAARMHAAR